MEKGTTGRFMVTSDEDLIRQVQQGSMTAFEELVFRYDKQVLSLAARYVLSAEDAKDIYQEVFLRVYRGLRRFRFQSQFATWLYRITTNVCLTHQKRQKKNQHISIGNEIALEQIDAQGSLDDHPLPDEQTSASGIAHRIREAVDALPPRQRMVFTLRHYEGYKLKEIAAMMRCTEGTVKRYLFLATQQMREQLTDIRE